MSKPREIKLPSDRSFGITFAVVGSLVGGWMLWKASRYYGIAFGIAAAFLLLALVAPAVLHPLNVVWMRFGALLNRIVSPIVLGAIYFVVMTPVALVFKVTGRDVLKRKFEKTGSYWIERKPPGPDGKTSFPRQF